MTARPKKPRMTAETEAPVLSERDRARVAQIAKNGNRKSEWDGAELSTILASVEFPHQPTYEGRPVGPVIATFEEAEALIAWMARNHGVGTMHDDVWRRTPAAHKLRMAARHKTRLEDTKAAAEAGRIANSEAQRRAMAAHLARKRLAAREPWLVAKNAEREAILREAARLKDAVEALLAIDATALDRDTYATITRAMRDVRETAATVAARWNSHNHAVVSSSHV